MDEFNDIRQFRNDIEDLQNFLQRRRRRKIYAERFNPLEQLNDEEFKSKYRFSKENMLKIVDLVKHELQCDTRGKGLPVHIQVMAVIRSWGRHEFQDDSAEIHGISQQTMSRTCKKVAIALARLSQQYIKMPMSLAEQGQAIRQFEMLCGFPHVIGAIDCTHIKIRKVGGEAGQYHINRKDQFSINTQVVCDSTLKINDIVCHWRGSTHDARIFRECSIKMRFEQNEFRGILLGDSGYACTPYLLTPVLRPQTEAEQNYNRKHIRTRNVVERCFGLWKQRFRILLEVMRGSYETIKTTIIACAVLHNLAIEWNDRTDNDEAVEPDSDEDEDNFVYPNNDIRLINRNLFIQNNFN